MEHYQKYIEKGYNEEQAFYLAEIKTTKQILTDLAQNHVYMPTLLINSLLSMIVLPYEKAKSNGDKIFKDKFSVFETRMGITTTLFHPIKSCEGNKVTYNYKTTKIFINKLRNGIAHQNITVSIIDDKDFNITIKNKYQNKSCNKCINPDCKKTGLKRENGGVIDFEITVNKKQLNKLANYISNSYIKAIECKEKNNEQTYN